MELSLELFKGEMAQALLAVWLLPAISLAIVWYGNHSELLPRERILRSLGLFGWPVMLLVLLVCAGIGLVLWFHHLAMIFIANDYEIDTPVKHYLEWLEQWI